MIDVSCYVTLVEWCFTLGRLQFTSTRQYEVPLLYLRTPIHPTAAKVNSTPTVTLNTSTSVTTTCQSGVSAVCPPLSSPTLPSLCFNIVKASTIS